MQRCESGEGGNKEYYENEEYPMDTVDSQLKIKIKNIDCLNQKVFIEFIYNNHKLEEQKGYEERKHLREDFQNMYEIDVSLDVSYGLRINCICENNKKFVKLCIGIFDKSQKLK